MVSSRCIYGLRAVFELAKHVDAGPVSASDIAGAQGIPVRFLEAILRQLKAAGLVQSVRGKAGGYRLGRAAESVAVAEVVELIDGPIGALREVAEAKLPEDDAVLGELWGEAAAEVKAIYEATSVQDLIDRAQVKKGFVENYMI